MAEGAYSSVGGEVDLSLARPRRSGTWESLARRETGEVIASTHHSPTV